MQPAALHKGSKKGGRGRNNASGSEGGGEGGGGGGGGIRLPFGLTMPLPAPLRVAAALASSVSRIVAALLAYGAAPFLTLFLRKIVRSVDFWRRGLTSAVGRSSAGAMATDATWVGGLDTYA
jgi:hypothetical protein